MSKSSLRTKKIDQSQVLEGTSLPKNPQRTPDQSEKETPSNF